MCLFSLWIDKEAVWSASQDKLHKLGLTESHIICLKIFCMPSAATADTDIKKELAAAVKQVSKHRVVAKKKKEIVSHIIKHKRNNQTREENCQS